jgi:hypothetical protein
VGRKTSTPEVELTITKCGRPASCVLFCISWRPLVFWPVSAISLCQHRRTGRRNVAPKDLPRQLLHPQKIPNHVHARLLCHSPTFPQQHHYRARPMSEVHSVENAKPTSPKRAADVIMNQIRLRLANEEPPHGIQQRPERASLFHRRGNTALSL